MSTVTNKVTETELTQRNHADQWKSSLLNILGRGGGGGYFPNKLSLLVNLPRVVKITVKRQKKQKLDVSD